MIQEITLPIKWVGYDQHEEMIFSYYEAIFTEDFGIFKKDELFSVISVNHREGIIEAYDDTEMRILKTQEFVGKPVQEKLFSKEEVLAACAMSIGLWSPTYASFEEGWEDEVIKFLENK